MNFTSFIETQFPVSKLSKESYKERKANNSQTLTGLGKWWGRKPLVLVRATIIGLLLPATDDPKKDLDIFLKLMTMDEEGIKQRQKKNIPASRLVELLTEEEIEQYLVETKDKWKWARGLMAKEKETIQHKALLRLGYDEQLNYCARPEQIEGLSPAAWQAINAHCKTNATVLTEWIEQMGQKQFGHTPKVGDAFSGGGSIPFEAARLGCEAYASDLNPVAALLTWAGLNIIGGGEKIKQEVEAAQKTVFEAVDKQITEWGIEHNEEGWRADAYLYCIETRCPETGYLVPLAPSWVISEKYKVCGVLRPDHENKRYHINIIKGADKETFAKAKKGTIQNSRLICPETGKEFAINSIRGDNVINGKTIYGLRMWENNDLVPRENDIFQERLYFIRYVETYYESDTYLEGSTKVINSKGKIIYELTKKEAEVLDNFQWLIDTASIKEKFRKHYVSPSPDDINRENKVLELLEDRFKNWQKKGFIPSTKISSGYNTDQPIRERGWTYWHHLFNPRQLLKTGVFYSFFPSLKSPEEKVGLMLGLGKLVNWNSRLTRWDKSPQNEKGTDTFSNQALNTIYNFSCRPILKLSRTWLYDIAYSEKFIFNSLVKTIDARKEEFENHFWITDPPYADAVNYHELADYFLSWHEKSIKRLFPEWHADSKSALAVKGKGLDFNKSMVEVYSNLNRNMPENGAQVVMFTHQDSKVWADLALILWASGLRVTAAWTIQTETDASGIKKGNYVQGTVLMVLRKQTSGETGFLFDIQDDVEQGVKEQIDFMRQLDNQEDSNFGDADYQLAAYAAALRELTKYQTIGEIDVEYELTKERKKGEISEVEKIIESAVKVAMDYLVPNGMVEKHWRKLQAEERFYLKGLEIEQGGEYRSGVYMEMARGYGLHEYTYLLNTSKANETRLKTASEFKTKELGKGGFGNLLTRQILFAIYETVRTENPLDGRNWLYNEWKGYWDDRVLIIHLLEFLINKCRSIPHWSKDVEGAELLKGYLENDTAV